MSLNGLTWGHEDVAVVSGGGDLNRPGGLALIATSDMPGGRIYLCDSQTHSIDVLDGDGLPLFSFGGYGDGPGQLDTPIDVAILTLDGSAITMSSDAILAVAERGNNRVQLFELDGAWLGILEDGLRNACWVPSRLDVDRRHLQITSSTGAVSRVDVAAALMAHRSWDDRLLGVAA
jgi:hypothetical protein